MILHLVARWRVWRCRWTQHDWTGWTFYAEHSVILPGLWERGIVRYCERCGEDQYDRVEWVPIASPAPRIVEEP